MGEVDLLGEHFGSHVIKTNNILGGALAGEVSSRFVMGIRSISHKSYILAPQCENLKSDLYDDGSIHTHGYTRTAES